MSNRSVDSSGFLHVKDNILTSEGISEYLGSEIPNHETYGLDINKKYKLYRPREELEKAKGSFNNILLLNEHVAISRDIPRKDLWIGSTGTESYVDQNGKLRNSVVINDPRAIEKAETGEINGLSCCYWYDLEVPKDRSDCDFIMRNLEGNHVAYVKRPRVNDARLSDSISEEKKGKYMNMKMDKLVKMLVGDKKIKSRAMDGAENEDVSDTEDMAMDNGMDQLLSALMEICSRSDEDFEDGMAGKKSTLQTILSNFYNSKEDTAMDEKEDMKDKEDSKSNEDDEDKKKEEKKKSQAMDSLIESKVEKRVKEEMSKKMAFDAAISVAEKLTGKLNKDSFAFDSEKVCDYVLKYHKIDSSGKSLGEKNAMIDVLLSQKGEKKPYQQPAMDSKKDSIVDSIPELKRHVWRAT